MAGLKEKLGDIIPRERERAKRVIAEKGDKTISSVTVKQAYGGMRGVKCLICDTSYLDPMEGIRFCGYTIPELIEKLPKAPDSKVPLPEAHWWLLLTGEIPTDNDVKTLQEDLKSRMKVPQYVWDILNAAPKNMHPMTMFSTAILAMQTESIFAKRYSEGMKKTKFWDAMYEDGINLVAKLPVIGAHIYRMKYRDGRYISPDPNLDWGGNFAKMMGIEDEEYKELMRLYFFLHSDHESGNVSAHTCHLVASALSDIYYAVSAAMDGLAGPLHGLANQLCLKWIMQMMDKLGGVPTKEQIKKYAWDTLNSGQVIPGYGHAVLRRTDPRFVAQHDFAMKYCPDDPIVKTVTNVYEVVPPILKEQGKAKNPWPNVDAHSGCLQYHYGVKEFDFYTVLFGIGRTLGITAETIWDRALMLPIERPKSVTTKWIEKEA
jgi:citrate synthase